MNILALILLAFFASDALASCILGVGDCKPKCDKFDKGSLKWAVKAYEGANCTGTERVSAAGDHSQPCTKTAGGRVEGSISWYISGGCNVSFHRDKRCKDFNMLGFLRKNSGKKSVEGWNHEGGFFSPNAPERSRVQARYWKVTCKANSRAELGSGLVLGGTRRFHIIKNEAKIFKISRHTPGFSHNITFELGLEGCRRHAALTHPSLLP
jgi:hypothetical protein